jgi:hypothetical protein
MTDEIAVYGAGLSGLIAGTLLSHRRKVVVRELQGSLPNNHSAVLRFRNEAMSNALGIEFRKVQVLKTSDSNYPNPLAAMMTYSRRATGEHRTDRSLPINPELVTRYIAPPNLIPMLANGLNIEYEQDIAEEIERRTKFKGVHPPIISTIPMTSIIKAAMRSNTVPFLQQTFKYSTGYNLRFKVENCDAYASLYAPSNIDATRITITGDEVVAEYIDYAPEPGNTMDTIRAICDLIGVDDGRVMLKSIDIKRQQYAKIVPIDDHWRKGVISWLTDTFNIYSLGRYACWRPGLLLDDLINDIRQIERLMKSNDYDRRMPKNG